MTELTAHAKKSYPLVDRAVFGEKQKKLIIFIHYGNSTGLVRVVLRLSPRVSTIFHAFECFHDVRNMLFDDTSVKNRSRKLPQRLMKMTIFRAKSSARLINLIFMIITTATAIRIEVMFETCVFL